MKKTNMKISAFVLVCFLITALFGCGVSQSEYDALLREKTTLEAEAAEQDETIGILQDELSALQNALSDAEAELNAPVTDAGTPDNPPPLSDGPETPEVSESQLSSPKASETSAAPVTPPPANENPGGSGMVWIPNSGTKYHSTATCSGMKNPTQVSLETAIARGYTQCKKCW